MPSRTRRAAAAAASITRFTKLASQAATWITRFTKLGSHAGVAFVRAHVKR